MDLKSFSWLLRAARSCQVHVDGLGIKPEMCSVVWRPGYDVEVEVESHEGPQRPTGALYKMGPPKALLRSRHGDPCLKHGMSLYSIVI